MLSNLTLGDRPDDQGFPVLDAHSLPKEIRHGAILGALDQVKPGRGIVLTAPHDPKRLLNEIEERWPSGFDVEYLERDTAWRLRLTKKGSGQ